MEGIITQLPQPYYQQVFDIWDDLSGSYNISGARGTTPIPHFTWHVAQSYSSETMEVIQKFLTTTRPPLITTTGLGIFHNPAPIIYISIHVTLTLLNFQADLLEAILPLSTGSVALYEAAQWTPHITLAMGDTDAHTTGEIISHYSTQRFDWQFVPDNISLISESSPGVYQEKDAVLF